MILSKGIAPSRFDQLFDKRTKNELSCKEIDKKVNKRPGPTFKLHADQATMDVLVLQVVKYRFMEIVRHQLHSSII